MACSPERFQALIDKSSDAISLLDPEGQVIFASTSMAKLLGFDPEELMGRNGLDLVHPQDRDHSFRLLKEVLAEPQSPNRMQVRVRQKDGRWLWVESTASNLLDDPRVGAIVLNYREISDRRAAEEEKQRQAEKLARANAELQAFAHTVAHDLREPLRTISTLTDLLAREAHLNGSEKEAAEFIVDAVRRMSALLDDLLAFGTCGFNDSPSPVELEHAAAQAIQNLREALASSGAIVTVGPLPAVQARETDLVRVFQNLIGNAVKYRSQAPVEIHLTAEPLGPGWVVKVRDNGIGIAKEHHQRMFGLFTRLHGREIPGTGIGLAICKKIVEGLGGRIWVESEPGAGSTFCFTVAGGGE